MPRTVFVLACTACVALATGSGVIETVMPDVGCAVLAPATSPVDHPAFPGYDTIRKCEYNPNNTGNTVSGNKTGFGVRLEPGHYPAIVSGVYHRVFQLATNQAVFRVVDDDGRDGGPGTVLYDYDGTVLPYSPNFHFNALPAPNCTIWDGALFLFILGREDVNNTLNWLHDGTRNSPDSVHWRFDGNGYYLFSPSGDMQMCAVVEYHDVALADLAGFPANDTVYVESTYAVLAQCAELAGFGEESVAVVLDIGGLQADTAWVGCLGGDTADVSFDGWQPAVPTGDYDCFCYTLLASDARTSNDTFAFQLTVTTGSGVGGSPPPAGREVTFSATVVSDVLRMGCGMQNAEYRAMLLDAAGRAVMELNPGENPVAHLAPGVYFAVRPSAMSCEPPAVRRVVIAR